MHPADTELTVNAFAWLIIHLNVAKRTVFTKVFCGKLSAERHTLV